MTRAKLAIVAVALILIGVGLSDFTLTSGDSILVVRESGEPSVLTGQVIEALRRTARDKGVDFRIEDPDLKDTNGNQPDWMKTILSKAAPPVVVTYTADGTKMLGCKFHKMPESTEQAVKFVEGMK